MTIPRYNLVSFKFNYKFLADILFVLYLIFPIAKFILIHLLPASIAPVPIYLVMGMLYLLLCAHKGRLLVIDFWAIYVFLCMFLGLTIIIHPEYMPWYTRKDFGVLDYVLSPQNGIFIYLFIRLINDPKRILHCVRFAGWPMYIFYGKQVIEALQMGYWIDTSNRGYEIHLTYNLSLGYNLLAFVLVYLFCALEGKRLSDIVGTIIGLWMILAAGSRGPFLCLGVFAVLYIFMKMERSKKKYIIIFVLILASILLWQLYPVIVKAVAIMVEKYEINSRFLRKLASDAITYDSGRSVIWAAAVNMIKTNPWGYGAMGSRHVITPIIYAGHPHQLFLELLIDYGVIGGSVLIIWLVFSSLRLLLKKGMYDWKAVFVLFFSRAIQLMVSLTYWHSSSFWGCLAIGVCIYKASKKNREGGRIHAILQNK